RCTSLRWCLRRIGRFDSVGLQMVPQISEMILVARFDCAYHAHRRDIAAGKGAIVHHLFDARTGGSNLPGEVSQPTGPVANHRGEPGEPAVSHQSPLDHATQNIWIDVSAAEKKHAFFAAELIQL